MSDPVYDLYQSCAYPAMSHPSTDPAVTAVAAKLAGLDVRNPSGARILEIGCASGHNLLPLAKRWPESQFTGIDFSTSAIHEACETARDAGLENVRFIETDLRFFNPGGEAGYDFIIAHGVYSWVPTDVRQALLDFCAANLSLQGLALISYNTLPGWSLRKSIVELTRLLTDRSVDGSIGHDPEETLGFLATAAGNHTSYARHLTAVLHDMFGKSGGGLPFDDFSPVNEPCTFFEFTRRASLSGLRYLGESQLENNFPAALAPGSSQFLAPLSKDPFALQQTIDVLTNRTFRSSLLCRTDASIQSRISTASVLQFSIRCPRKAGISASEACLTGPSGEVLARFEDPHEVAFFTVLDRTSPESVPIHEVIEQMKVLLQGRFDSTRSMPLIARLVMDCTRHGHVLLRYEPVRFDFEPPTFPKLDPLGLLAARKDQPLVDLYHASYLLDEVRKPIALAMDGSKPLDVLVDLAKNVSPKFDFRTWIGHLAARGMFID